MKEWITDTTVCRVLFPLQGLSTKRAQFFARCHELAVEELPPHEWRKCLSLELTQNARTCYEGFGDDDDGGGGGGGDDIWRQWQHNSDNNYNNDNINNSNIILATAVTVKYWEKSSKLYILHGLFNNTLSGLDCRMKL